MSGVMGEIIYVHSAVDQRFCSFGGEATFSLPSNDHTFRDFLITELCCFVRLVIGAAFKTFLIARG
jgi:hypothetical protein